MSPKATAATVLKRSRLALYAMLPVMVGTMIPVVKTTVLAARDVPG